LWRGEGRREERERRTGTGVSVSVGRSVAVVSGRRGRRCEGAVGVGVGVACGVACGVGVGVRSPALHPTVALRRAPARRPQPRSFTGTAAVHGGRSPHDGSLLQRDPCVWRDRDYCLPEPNGARTCSRLRGDRPARGACLLSTCPCPCPCPLSSPRRSEGLPSRAWPRPAVRGPRNMTHPRPRPLVPGPRSPTLHPTPAAPRPPRPRPRPRALPLNPSRTSSAPRETSDPPEPRTADDASASRA
jgi:hypothetical protein